MTDQCTCTHGSVDVLLHLSLTYDLTPKTFMRFFPLVHNQYNQLGGFRRLQGWLLNKKEWSGLKGKDWKDHPNPRCIFFFTVPVLFCKSCLPWCCSWFYSPFLFLFPALIDDWCFPCILFPCVYMLAPCCHLVLTFCNIAFPISLSLYLKAILCISLYPHLPSLYKDWKWLNQMDTLYGIDQRATGGRAKKLLENRQRLGGLCDFQHSQTSSLYFGSRHTRSRRFSHKC